MQKPKTATSTDDGASTRERLMELVIVVAVLTVAAATYSLLFNRSNVLSHSIGYNLYASERVMEGAVPYRDFHTLYPPATFYLNAFLFKWLGVSLLSALLGVLVFKTLTVLAIFVSARQVMPRAWALAATLSSILWLRPNGPFKSVPMHYGALLLTLGMYLSLKYENRRRLVLIFLAGVSLGLVALFKQNIGAYSLVGLLALLILGERSEVRQTPVCRDRPSEGLQASSDKLKIVGPRNYLPGLVLLAGCATAIVPALIYMQVNGALAAMIKTLLFGPGEFLLSRLAIPLSPVAPVMLAVAIAGSALVSRKTADSPAIGTALLLILIAAISGFVLRGNQADVNQIIFYLPIFVLGCGFLIAIFTRTLELGERRGLLIVFVFSAAALMELFPRFAREQSIAAMPLVMLFLFYLLYLQRPAIRALAGGKLRYRLALAVLPLTFSLIEGRLFFDTYIDSALRFKAGSEVSIERGRGVYFPTATAAVVDNAVSHIQQSVPIGGNAFAQSDAGTSLLFLSNRRNVSNAQFWIGVGVTQEERAATLARIDKSQTKLIITSDEVLAAEKYEPMRDYIERHFKPTVRFDDVLILER